MLADGLYRREKLAREAYDALGDLANYSTIKLFAKSAAHYHGRGDRKDTTPLRNGRVVHLAVLEPERFAAEVVAFPGERRAGKEWEAFKVAHAGKEIVKADEYAEALAIAAAVRANPTAADLLAEGAAEVTAIWTDAATGVRCRGRLDWVATTGGVVAVDLKSTKDASPAGFARILAGYAYHAQAAFYADALKAVTGDRVPYQLIAVESAAPYVTQVYELDDEAIDAGRRLYRGWLERLAACRESGRWPGYADGPLTLSLPRWADRAGLGDDENNETDENDEPTNDET